MIYHRICPYCQELCRKSPSEDPEVSTGRCSHLTPLFKYNFIECEKSIIIDIITEEIYLMIQIDTAKKSFVKTFSKIKTHTGEVLLEGVVPIDWNNFEFDSFVKKVKKIFEMNVFN